MTRTTKHSTSRCSLDLKQFAGCRWASRPIGTCLPPSTRRESARPSLPHTPYLFVHDLSGSTKLWLFVTPLLGRPKYLLRQVSILSSQDNWAPIAPISATNI